MIGIIGAMDKEIDDLKSVMKDVSEEKISGMTFYKGALSGKDVVLVRSGIGKVNAAMCTEALIIKYNVECVINTGIAGSLNSKIDIGDVVLSTDSLEHDMDVSGLGYDKGVVPDQECSIYPAADNIRKIAKEACEAVNPDIKVFEGRVVSGDKFVSDKETKDFLVNTFNGMCTEMEGASIAHTAYLNNVPYLVIRAISDKADDSADMDYPSFQKKAIIHSVRLVEEMMRRM
ncbi:adenosylhomocysteine nucleosidase [Eubacterium ruminantium]|uniref:adenosylhomocysteine nucleosidase n=1 Tax=Eubacterium ruminantium TaxID=42322 RepID=A0A1T4JYX8_9FIRM|nr:MULTISPECIES: 5'-methylthioadenosine/adenosylhomocysteine nucleosidase [Eubacterium]MCR5368050.1 5'-methylthioadenosine/adenosylhomocysteine nucleosidase [Eubacterium sp.]SCW29117.1 adenosylhomocysteine nucleosidase [Eubacterium ruminantium]SDM09549.1 adenosylhomocysteine nucleosidase [Eubacterium ruminantium]SJZ35334.1 adenosylhomocysteine nucleosidase [Eubacterium ruminantium]